MNCGLKLFYFDEKKHLLEQVGSFRLMSLTYRKRGEAQSRHMPYAL